jgi:hypothetical protein
VAEGRVQPTVPAQTQPVAPQGPPQEPDPDTYEDWGKYRADLKEYQKQRDAWLVQETAREISSKQETAQRQTQAKTADETFQARLTKYAETDPEIHDILNNPSLVVSNPMAEIIKQSEIGPKLIRYLYDHPEEAKAIYQLAPTVRNQDGSFAQLGNPLAAARQLGLLEAKLSTPQTAPTPVQKISQAPAPVQTVNGNSQGGTVDLEALPMDEYFRVRNSQDPNTNPAAARR